MDDLPIPIDAQARLNGRLPSAAPDPTCPDPLHRSGGHPMDPTTTDRDLTAEVQASYAAAARAALALLDGEAAAGSPCGCAAPMPAADGEDPSTTGPASVLPVDERDRFGASRYAVTLEDLPAGAALASLGCGEPTAVAELRAGETVLDLGAGAGLDLLLSARRVGPRGTVYGLDLTEEMLALARRNLDEAGVTNAHLLHGRIEAIPLEDASVDVAVSNCVINLSEDKPAVFRELARVVRDGGRLAISDVVADDQLTPQQRAERGSHVGCIAGALSAREYREGLAAVGFAGIEVAATHVVADGMHAAVIRAVRAVRAAG